MLFLLLCLPLAVLRLGIPSCVRFLAVLSGCFVSRRVCVDPLGLAVAVSKEPGLLEAGPKRCYRRGLVVPTGPLFWICVLVSTVLRQHLDLNFLPSSNLLPATGSSSVTWLNPLPFRNPSPASSRLESTRKLPASLTGALPSECHHGLSFSFDFGLLGSSDSRRRALRVGMACVGGGWRRSADFGFATPSRRFLPALPLGFLPEERCPSTLVVVPLAVLDNGSLSPTGVQASVLVVDFQESVVQQMRLPLEFEEINFSFDLEQPYGIPSPPDLEEGDVPKELLQTNGASDLDTPQSTRRKERRTPVRWPDRPSVAAKKPSVATLASALQQVLEPNQGMSSQLQALTQRQQVLEQQLVAIPSQSSLHPCSVLLFYASLPQPP